MCRYNMFNHHFFDGEKSRKIYLDFLRQDASSLPSNQSDILVVLDPPFGGLVDVLAFTLQSITEDFCQMNPEGMFII